MLALDKIQMHKHFKKTTIDRAVKRTEGALGKDFKHEAHPKLFVVGVAINERCWFRVFTCVEVYFYINHPLLKALMIILLKRAFTH